MVFPRILWDPWVRAGREVLQAMDAVLRPGTRPVRSLGGILLATLAAWMIYVPVHELLHALGCVAAGGTVEEIQIARLYGGGILARVLPFVRPGGVPAGRLAEFDTGGSDLVHLATDFAPFLLTVAGAFPLLRSARRRGSALRFGPGIVLASAPVVSLIGDYYEIGSILVSAALRITPSGIEKTLLPALRHDDLPALLNEFSLRFPRDRLLWGAAVAASALLGWILAGATLAAGRGIADAVSPGKDS